MKNLVLLLVLMAAVAACARPQSTAPTGAAAVPINTPQAVMSTTSGRLGGVIEGYDHGNVTLVGGEHFSLTPDARIIRAVPVDPTALQAGEFVAVTAKRQPDGTLLASVVNIFPESMRGLGEGQRPMDGGNLMTNATVSDVAPNLMTNATVNAVGGTGFSVLFPGGGDEVKLADDAEVHQFETADTSDLVPGTSITAVLSNGTAQFVTIF